MVKSAFVVHPSSLLPRRQAILYPAGTRNSIRIPQPLSSRKASSRFRQSTFISTTSPPTPSSLSSSTCLALSSPLSFIAKLSGKSTASAGTSSSSLMPPTAVTWQLLGAFLLGGIFTSIILPRLGLIAWGMWQRLGVPRSWIERFRSTFHKTSDEDDDKNTDDTKKNKRNRIFRARKSFISKTKLTRKQLALQQYVLDRLDKLSMQTQLQLAMKEVFEDVAENPNIRRVELKKLEVISTPKIFSGAYYDLGLKAMAFDVQMVWNDAFELQLDVTTQRLGLIFPVRIYNVKVLGTLRVLLTPLMEEPPGFGAIVTSFKEAPTLSDLQIDLAGGSVTSKAPWLRDELISQLQKAFNENLVWPNRSVQPSLRPNPNATILDAHQIEELLETDPFLEAERHGLGAKEESAQDMKKKKSKKNAEGEKDDDKDGGGKEKAWIGFLESLSEVLEKDD